MSQTAASGKGIRNEDGKGGRSKERANSQQSHEFAIQRRLQKHPDQPLALSLFHRPDPASRIEHPAASNQYPVSSIQHAVKPRSAIGSSKVEVRSSMLPEPP